VKPEASSPFSYIIQSHQVMRFSLPILAVLVAVVCAQNCALEGISCAGRAELGQFDYRKSHE
jgi:hypothetical protein